MITGLELAKIGGAIASAIGTFLMALPFFLNGRNRDASWLLSTPARRRPKAGPAAPEQGEDTGTTRDGADHRYPKGGKVLAADIEAGAQDGLDQEMARTIPLERRFFIAGLSILFLGQIAQLATLWFEAALN